MFGQSHLRIHFVQAPKGGNMLIDTKKTYIYTNPVFIILR